MKKLQRVLIKCECGCGESLENRDSYGRLRKFLNGHNGKKYSDRLEHKKVWRIKNKESISAKEKERKLKIKNECLTHYGNQCSCCSETEQEFLTFDHINGNGSTHRREIKGNNIYNILKKEGYPDTYRILCFNCNWSSYLGGGVCKHKRK